MQPRRIERTQYIGQQKRAMAAATAMPTIDIKPSCINPANPDSIMARKPALEVSIASHRAAPQHDVVLVAPQHRALCFALPLNLHVDSVVDRLAHQCQARSQASHRAPTRTRRSLQPDRPVHRSQWAARPTAKNAGSAAPPAAARRPPNLAINVNRFASLWIACRDCTANTPGPLICSVSMSPAVRCASNAARTASTASAWRRHRNQARASWQA